MFLGTRMKQAVTNLPNPLGTGFYTIEFAPSDFQIRARTFVIKHISIRGPSGSSLELWIDNTFRDATPRGDLNSWDPAQPLPMKPGQSMFIYWNVGTGTRPQATLDCYTDEIF